jgi:glutathione S-transferase
VKLYFVPGTCSLAPSIVLREGRFDFATDRVDVRNGKKTDGGKDYLAVNPKGYVPALELDDGRVLTECAVIVQWLADQKPGSNLAPEPGSIERLTLQEWLLFIATELHKAMSPFYQPTATEDFRAVLRGRIDGRLAYLEKHLASRPFIMGEHFTVADAYAFYTLRAAQKVMKATLTPGLAAYYVKLAQPPAVAEALKFEQLEA